jgi:hypothetical protein
MIILANVYFDVLRSSYTSTGGTSEPLPYLQRIEGHLTRIKDSMLMPMSTSAFKATYELYADPEIDIQLGDVVANIIRKDSEQPFFFGQSDEMYRVTDAVNSAPGFVEYRDVTIERIVGGGPIQ